jgi:hypothetical protein
MTLRHYYTSQVYQLSRQHWICAGGQLLCQLPFWDLQQKKIRHALKTVSKWAKIGSNCSQDVRQAYGTLRYWEGPGKTLLGSQNI